MDVFLYNSCRLFVFSYLSSPSSTIAGLSGGGTNGGNVLLGNKNLIINQSFDSNYGGIISGSGGSLTKTGTCSLMLTGINTYTGGTTVSDGMLFILSDSNLGDASGTLTLDGGKLAVTKSITISRPITTTGTNGGWFDTGVNTVELSGVISGNGSLKKSGTGTLTLSGDNTYTWYTTIYEGTLVMDKDYTVTPVFNITVTFGSTFNNKAQLTVNGALLNASGTVNNDGLITVNGSLSNDGTVNNDGLIIVETGGTLTGTNPLQALHLDANGGTGSITVAEPLAGTTSTFDFNKLATFDKKPTKTGFALLGWSTTSSGSPLTGSPYTFTDGDILYARWGELPVITSASPLPGGTVGTAYSQTLTATGDGTILWEDYRPAGVSQLPDGLTISSDGVISGTPTATGTFNFEIRVSNLAGGNAKTFSITINSTLIPPTPTSPHITGPISLKLFTGYKATSTKAFTITGTSPVTVTKTSGDDHIIWNNVSRKLDITAGLSAGEYNVELLATNSAGSDAFIFVLTVETPVYFYLDLPQSFKGGTVQVQTKIPYLATEGETVTLILTPDDGFELGTIYIHRRDNPDMIVPLSGTGYTRTFTMPAYHVMIVVVFKSIGTAFEETLHATSLQAYVQDGVLYVIQDSDTLNPVRVYNILGTLIYQTTSNPSSGGAGVVLPGRGVYIVTDGSRVIKVMN
jgi:autotransporter-associated beta strand protein